MKSFNIFAIIILSFCLLNPVSGPSQNRCFAKLPKKKIKEKQKARTWILKLTGKAFTMLINNLLKYCQYRGKYGNFDI